MPTYRVGVVLTASGASFNRGFKSAAGQVGRTRSALQQARGSVSAFGRAADESGRRAYTALQRASGQAGKLGTALQRTAGQARQTGGAIDAAVGRSNQKVRGLVQSFRDLGRAMRDARGGAGGGEGGGWSPGRAIAGAAGAVGAGFTVTMAAGREIDYESRLDLLGRSARRTGQAHWTPEAMSDLRRQIEAVALRDDIRIDPSQLLAAVEESHRLWGDLDGAVSKLDTFATTIGFGAGAVSGTNVGALSVQVGKAGDETDEALRQAIALMISASDGSSFGLQALASPQTSRALTQFITSARGQRGPEILQHFAEIAQIASAATGGSVEVSTDQIRSISAAITDRDKIKKLNDLGVFNVTSQSPLVTLEEAVRLTDGRLDLMSDIWGETASALVGLFTDQVGIDRLAKIRRQTAAARADYKAAWAQIEADVANSADTSRARRTQMGGRAQAWFGEYAGGPVGDAIYYASELQGPLVGVAAGAYAGGRFCAAGAARPAGGATGAPPTGPRAGSRARSRGGRAWACRATWAPCASPP